MAVSLHPRVSATRTLRYTRTHAGGVRPRAGPLAICANDVVHFEMDRAHLHGVLFREPPVGGGVGAEGRAMHR
jgi:hypothetical protein